MENKELVNTKETSELNDDDLNQVSGGLSINGIVSYLIANEGKKIVKDVVDKIINKD